MARSLDLPNPAVPARRRGREQRPGSGARLVQRAANVALGASIGWWTLRAWGDAPASPVTVGVTALNLLVALLFATRLPERRAARLPDLAAALPALAVGALVLALAPAREDWPVLSEVFFLGATAWTCASLLTLGRCFAVFPSLRRVVVRGPYRLIRHPAYAGELAMLGACVSASPGPLPLLALAAAAAFVAVRVLAEERTLALDDAYQKYAADTPWRLLPGLW